MDRKPHRQFPQTFRLILVPFRGRVQSTTISNINIHIPTILHSMGRREMGIFRTRRPPGRPATSSKASIGMGLFDKLKGELIDIIEWTDDSRDTLVYRFERRDNEIKMGAKLTVRESQAA